jgi:UDP-N-acetylglucosamine transferase subunit ALG13
LIFVAVGTQMPFDRLIRTVDQWAGTCVQADVVAQVGPSTYKPENIRTCPFLSPRDFRQHIEKAKAVVSHAGMGTIITALELGKPILVMPRLASLGEHRNDHQVATAKRFVAQGRIQVACDEQELENALGCLDVTRAVERIGSQASPALLQTISAFLTSHCSSTGARTDARSAVPAVLDES